VGVAESGRTKPHAGPHAASGSLTQVCMQAQLRPRGSARRPERYLGDSPDHTSTPESFPMPVGNPGRQPTILGFPTATRSRGAGPRETKRTRTAHLREFEGSVIGTTTQAPTPSPASSRSDGSRPVSFPETLSGSRNRDDDPTCPLARGPSRRGDGNVPATHPRPRRTVEGAPTWPLTQSPPPRAPSSRAGTAAPRQPPARGRSRRGEGNVPAAHPRPRNTVEGAPHLAVDTIAAAPRQAVLPGRFP